MTTHVDKLTASFASMFLSDLSARALNGGFEDYQAGGSFPDILHDLKREGHICDDLYIAGCRLVHDLTRCHGTSAGLTAKYGDQVDAGTAERLPPRYATDLDAFNRVERVLSMLAHHERGVLTFCVLAREKKRGALSDFGRLNSAFKTRQQSRAFAIGQIKAMLQSVYEAYRLKIPIMA